MTAGTPPPQPRTKPQVETGRYLAGGLIASVIAAVAGVVVWGLANTVLDRDLFTDLPDRQPQDLALGAVVVVALLAGLVATVVLYLFVMAVPRPVAMFRALGALIIAASMLPILSMDTSGFDLGSVETQNQIALAVLHLVVGCTIIGLLDGVARSTVRFVHQQVPPPGPPQQPSYPQQQPPAGYQQQPPPQPGGSR
jgi:hypothetical protein